MIHAMPGLLLVGLVAWLIRGTWRAASSDRPRRGLARWTLITIGVGFVVKGGANSLYFEPTQDALHRADWGHRQIGIGILLVIIALALGYRKPPTSFSTEEADNSED